jgi:hypothetical protein
MFQPPAFIGEGDHVVVLGHEKVRNGGVSAGR